MTDVVQPSLGALAADENRVLLIGAGQSGSRFLKALDFLYAEGKLPSRISICDCDESKLAPHSAHCCTFQSLDRALHDVKPTIVAVCVNEFAHYDVLRRLPREGLAVVLCEKPLAETVLQVEQLDHLARNHLSINLTERFSPVCDEFRAWWSSQPELQVLRVESHWGKCRLSDSRPTMGVLAEVIHPLDLIDHLFGLDAFSIEQISGLRSNFGPTDEMLLDSLDVVLQSSQFPVVLRSSFLWPERLRTLSVLAIDRRRQRYLIHFAFDHPQWDCDRLEIFLAGDSDFGPKELLHQFSRQTSDYPPQLAGVYKVKEYIRRTLESVGGRDDRLVGYDQALKLQRWLQEMALEADRRKGVLAQSLDFRS
jgi:predicted dehydrogenase